MTTGLPGDAAPAAHRAEVGTKISLGSEIRRMAAVIWHSRDRHPLLPLGAGLIVVVAAIAGTGG